jgi:hypothetical protein
MQTRHREFVQSFGLAVVTPGIGKETRLVKVRVSDEELASHHPIDIEQVVLRRMLLAGAPVKSDGSILCLDEGTIYATGVFGSHFTEITWRA